MQLVAANCQLSEVTEPLNNRLYSALRSKGKQGEALLERLVPCVETALHKAGWEAQEIDLIVSMSLSPDHLVAKCNVMGPRIGHPLQRALHADNAFVFDAMDASLAKTLHIVNTLALSQGYQRILVVRAENTVNLQACAESGFDISNGVMALLLTPGLEQQFYSLPIAGDFSPLRVMLNTVIHNEDSFKGAFTLQPQPALNHAINRSIDEMLSNPDFSQDTALVESWLVASKGHAASLGPFEIPYRLSTQGALSKALNLISIDLFSMNVNGVSLKYAQGGRHA